MRLSPKDKGFTLIELLVVIAILGILSSVTLPSLFQYYDKQKIQSAQKLIFSMLRSARLQALTRSKTVVVCASNNQSDCAGSSKNWSGGWIVFMDLDQNKKRDADTEDILMIQQAEKSYKIIWNRGSAISYNYEGNINLNGSFYICSDKSVNDETARAVIINRVGRAYQSKRTASGEQITC